MEQINLGSRAMEQCDARAEALVATIKELRAELAQCKP
jgi:hypothetical protein